MLLLLFVYFLIPKRIGWNIGKQRPLLRGITSFYFIFSLQNVHYGHLFGCLKHVFIAGSCANIGFLFVYLFVSQVAGTFHDNSIGHIKMNYVVSRLVVITNKEVLFFFRRPVSTTNSNFTEALTRSKIRVHDAKQSSPAHAHSRPCILTYLIKIS